eukprot:4382634-Amphidinium_carterae.1
MHHGELGSRCCPYIYDDGATDRDSVPRLKAFLDVSAEDAGVSTRYSSARLVSHQLRQLCSNSYDPDAEPPAYDITSEMTHESFINRVKDVFPKSLNKVDLMACLKRCKCSVIGAKQAVVRLPHPDKVRCRVMPFPPDVSNTDLMLSESVRDKLKAYKGRNDKNTPSSFDEGMNWHFVQVFVQDWRSSGP